MASFPTWTPEGVLVHIGTMNPQDKGVDGDSFEGHGLSVSECPDAWAHIARLGGRPWWRLERYGRPARFLDWMAMDEAQRGQIIAWGIAEGLVEPAEVARVHWFDADAGERVFTEFESEAEAQAEYEGLLEEHGEVEEEARPTLEVVACHALTDAARARLRLRTTSAFQTLELLCTLYCEDDPMESFDGVYWNARLDPYSLSAPCAVILPSRLAWFPFELHPDSPVRAVHPQVGQRFANAVEDGKPDELAKILLEPGAAEVVGQVFPVLQGTAHMYAVERCVFMAGTDDEVVAGDGVPRFKACADLLRDAGAPVAHRNGYVTLAQILLDTDWSTSSHAAEVAELFGACLAAGLVPLDRPLPPSSTPVSRKLPLSAAILMGNVRACALLLQNGAPIDAAALDCGTDDLVSFARAVGRKNSCEVAALLCEQMLSAALSTPTALAPMARTRRRVQRL